MARKQDKWCQLVDTLHLDLTQPLNFVTAAQVKVVTHEEPRLMAAMDSERLLPECFRQHGVFVLPVSSDRYALVHGKGYHELEPVPGEPTKFPARLPFEMATLAYGQGEGRYLLHAFHSGLLSRFTGVREMYQAVTGKMRTRAFTFRVDGSPTIEVQGAGMEVDAGFEGRGDVLLFEAKAQPRLTFLIRQLYYPYRAFSQVTSKAVRAFFFVAEPKRATYTLWEYRWADPGDYESIKLTNAGSFLIEPEEPPVEALEAIEPDPALDIVPQADDLQKVADFPLLVNAGVKTARQWADHYGITERQGSYYREAAQALGLVKWEDGEFGLTEEGKRYVAMDPQRRADFLAGRILKNRLMNEVFRRVQRSVIVGVSKEEVARIIEGMSHLGGSTPIRRASTVLAYFRWMAQTTGAIVVKDGRIYPRQGTLDRFGVG